LRRGLQQAHTKLKGSKPNRGSLFEQLELVGLADHPEKSRPEPDYLVF
jgi:hypothetical protein